MDTKKIMVTTHTGVYGKDFKDESIYDFIIGIKEGKWQDQVLKARIELSKTRVKKERNDIKKPCKLFRLSGSFSGNSDSDIRKHSGFLAVDLDNVENPNKVKEVLKSDPYIYAAFLSISGEGLCLLVRIDGSRHLDAFEGVAKYLYETYQLIADQSTKNVSRARFVSYDPYIHINEDAILFKKYLPKPKIKKISKIVYVESDLDRIIKEIYDRGLNLCEDYSDWISICYALVSEFGDSQTGRNYFHTLSSLSGKYNEKDTDKQYDSCLKTQSEGKKKVSTIGTIYHYAKINGIEIYSQQTKDIIRAASSQSKSGVSKDAIAKSLEKFNNIPEIESAPIIDQVIASGIEHQSENIIDDILYFLQPYGLKKNLITRNVEMNGKALDDSNINTLFIDCKSIFEKVTKDLVCSVIYSDKIEQYNPLKDFFISFDQDNSVEVDANLPNVNKLIRSIKSDTENYNKWVTKWLVSCVASAFGTYSPLVLVFSGEKQGTGKTYFFRYLLPKKLRYLFAESDMDNGKDDEILMTKKLIILDDEYGGKSKKEEKKLKKITAKEFINVREPYGRVSVDLRRIAVFCGTSNDTQIISDPTGNRRVLPIHILDIDHDMYNSCDKEMLWHEIYALYKDGYDYTVLKSEIQDLNDNTDMFNASTPEEELIRAKLSIPEDSIEGEWLTVTEIINILIMDTKYNVMNNTRVGMILNKYGYQKQRFRKNGIPATQYYVKRVNP